MSKKEEFYKFSDNTKLIYNLLNISLFFIIILIINPFNMGINITTLGKSFIIILLTFILTKNFNETINFTKQFPNLFNNIEYINIKNNIVLSHIVTILILYLIFYIISTFFLTTSKI